MWRSRTAEDGHPNYSVLPRSAIFLLVMGIGCFLLLYIQSRSNPLICVLAAALYISLIMPLLVTKHFDVLQPLGLMILLFGGYLCGALYAMLVDAGYLEARLSQYITTDVLNVADPQSSRALGMALVLVMAGFFAFLLGYRHTTVTRKIAAAMPVPSPSNSTVRLRLVVVLYSLVGILGFYLRLKASGGLWNTLINLHLYAERVTTGYVSALILLLPLASLLWRYSGVRLSWLFWLHAVFTVGCLLLTGVRNNIVLYMLLLFNHRWYLGKLVRLRILVATALMVVLISFGALVFRHGTGVASYTNLSIGTILAEDWSLSNFIEYVLTSGDYTDITTLARLQQVVPKQLPYRYGSTLLNAAFAAVPRELWPSKPPQLDLELATYFFGDWGLGLPPTFMAETFLNFGVPGILVCMFLVGLVSRIAYEYLRLNRANAWAVFFYGLFNICFLANLVRVHFAAGVGIFLQFAVPSYLAISMLTWAPQKHALDLQSAWTGPIAPGLRR